MLAIHRNVEKYTFPEKSISSQLTIGDKQYDKNEPMFIQIISCVQRQNKTTHSPAVLNPSLLIIGSTF
jgi:uncharacterized protein YdaL